MKPEVSSIEIKLHGIVKTCEKRKMKIHFLIKSVAYILTVKVMGRLCTVTMQEERLKSIYGLCKRLCYIGHKEVEWKGASAHRQCNKCV